MPFSFHHFILCCLLFSLRSSGGALSLHMSSNNVSSRSNAEKLLFFCSGCPAPDMEGSIDVVKAMAAKFGPQKYDILRGLSKTTFVIIYADVVYAFPNTASISLPLNHMQLKDRIALVDRGQVAIVDKIRSVQKAGALAVIVADDGSCDEEFSIGSCGARFGSLSEGGFGARDLPSSWSDVSIPSVLVTRSTASRLKQHMDLVSIRHPVHGEQYIDKNSLEEEEEHDEL